MHDVLIVGGGPAGLSAAVYSSRAGMKTALVERLVPGGQMTLTSDIDNYPGLEDVTGAELAQRMEDHARKAGAEILYSTVTGFDLAPGALAVLTDQGPLNARALILCTGTRRRLMDVPGEREYAGRGVSYCATCDGAFFRGKEVVVVGGGSTALEDALYLSRLCKKVYLVHRRQQFRGEHVLDRQVRAESNIELVLDHVPVEVLGEQMVTELKVRHVGSGKERTLAVGGVFVAVGTLPESEMLGGALDLDEGGRVIAGEDCATKVPGVFVAGDLRQKPLYQIVTAAADGAVAATMASRFVQQNAPQETTAGV